MILRSLCNIVSGELVAGPGSCWEPRAAAGPGSLGSTSGKTKPVLQECSGVLPLQENLIAQCTAQSRLALHSNHE